MQIPPSKIQEILERIDIVALISRYVELKPSGRSLKGLCPFHGEKTPSFHVNPENRYFKCFGCEAGGDAISFLKRLNNQSFLDVVRELAKEAGVDLEEREDPAARERARMHEANEFARRHFEERLWSDPRARLGREHLQARGVDEAAARRFGLGYALNSWDDLCVALAREGILEWAEKAGLCSARRQGPGHFDAFRGRLTIPIRSAESRTVAFGARLVEDTSRPGGEPGPKYLNSRESPVYRKSETLYALDLAKDEIRKQKTAILVEGYFDVIGLHTAGVTNAVALCSTALTSGHLAALGRVGAQELVMLLDGDAAGIRAVERLGGPILASGIRARVASLPAGDDPDTFALREGRGALDALLAGATPLSAYLLHNALPRGRASGFEEKMAALARLKPLLEQLPPGMARTLLIAEFAEHFGVSEGDVRGHLLQEIKPARPRPAPQAPASPARRPLDGCEELFAALLISDASLREAPEARFIDEIRALEVRVLLQSAPGPEGLSGLPELFKGPIVKRMTEISQTLADPDARRQALRDTTTQLRLARVEDRLADKKAELEQAVAEGLEDDLARLTSEYQQLSGLKQRLRARSGDDGR